MTTWRAPFTGGDKKILPIGLRFIVDYDPPTHATAVSASAQPYAHWEPLLVDAEDLRADKYSGYYLVIQLDDVETFCRKLP